MPAVTILCDSFQAVSMPDGKIMLTLDGVPSETPPLFFKEEAAAYLRVTPRTLSNLMSRRKNPIPYTRAAGRPRFNRDDIDRWMHSAPPASVSSLLRLVG